MSTGAIAAAVLFLGVWAFSLSRSLLDPIGYDQALYQYMAERIIAGEKLYVDVWDQNGPGIVAIHWVSTRLVGSSPVAHRLFDAIWQGFTLIALAMLAVRSGRGWSVGWLAAALYALAYYSLGYVQTAQREGFAVLPMLLSLHLVAGVLGGGRIGCTSSSEFGIARVLLHSFVAGALCLFIFTIKPPLGLFFALLWLYLLGAALRLRRSNPGAPAAWLGLNVGFLAAAAAGVGLLVHLGSWDGFWGVLSRRDMPGYILGPRLLRELTPMIVAGGGVIFAIGWTARRLNVLPADGGVMRPCIAGFAVFVLLLTCRYWSGWQHIIVCFAGLWIPAMGAMIVRPWKDRSDTRRLASLMLVAAAGALILQGQFFAYHLPPLLAAAAYLAATQCDELWRELRSGVERTCVWLAVCAGCVVYLAVGQWWPTMSFATARPYVLAGTTLADHYTSITKHKPSCPTYATTIKVAERICELTKENQPIACLLHEARIYYFARRPSVHKLIAMQVAYQHMFGDYMQAIRDRRPKVIAARIPERLRDSSDLQAIQSAVYDEAESFFGPSGRAIRELYTVSERIDDVCLLRPSIDATPMRDETRGTR